MQTPKLNEVKQQAGFSLEDINIEGFAPMPSPAEIKKMAPLTEAAAENVNKSRNQIKQILTGEDDRLMVITGPCSIHDPKAALDYAWLSELHALSMPLYALPARQRSCEPAPGLFHLYKR